jgi:hypothetical protein
MSNDTTTKSPVAAVPADSTEEKAPNAVVRTFRRIKTTPKKTAIAVGLGVGLVAAGAFLGRKSANSHLEIVQDDYEPEPLVVTSTDEQSA